MISFEVTDATKNKSQRSPWRSDFTAIMSGGRPRRCRKSRFIGERRDDCQQSERARRQRVHDGVGGMTRCEKMKAEIKCEWIIRAEGWELRERAL